MAGWLVAFFDRCELQILELQGSKAAKFRNSTTFICQSSNIHLVHSALLRTPNECMSDA